MSGRLAAESPRHLRHRTHVVSMFWMEKRNSDRMGG